MNECAHVWVLIDERFTRFKEIGRPGDRGYQDIPVERRRRFYCSVCRATSEDVEERRWQDQGREDAWTPRVAA